jgi:hypothetical protein
MPEELNASHGFTASMESQTAAPLPWKKGSVGVPSRLRPLLLLKWMWTDDNGFDR